MIPEDVGNFSKKRINSSENPGNLVFKLQARLFLIKVTSAIKFQFHVAHVVQVCINEYLPSPRNSLLGLSRERNAARRGAQIRPSGIIRLKHVNFIACPRIIKVMSFTFVCSMTPKLLCCTFNLRRYDHMIESRARTINVRLNVFV